MNTSLTSQQPTVPPATRREWIGLAILALPTLLISVDVSVLYVALPTLGQELKASSTQQMWILDIYSFLLAGLLVTMGGLADRVGSRRLLLIGGTAFGAVSVLAAYAQSPEMLIASRALLGVAGATLMPSTMSLIRHMFKQPAQMAQALSIWLACFMGGATAGPIVGGALLEHFWWGSVFLLGVPVMVVLVLLAPRLLPESPRSGEHTLPDTASVVLSLVALLPAVYGLKELARGGQVALAVAALAVSLIAGMAFVRRQGRLADPLVDLALFSNRQFSVGLGTFLTTGVVMAGTSYAAAMYLQGVLGLSPLAAGAWLIPQNLVMIAGTLFGPRLDRRFHTVHLVAGGMFVAGAGLLLIGFVGTDSLGLHLVAMIVVAAGISVPMSLIMNLIMGAAPPERAASAASLAEMGGELGIALGVATMGSLLTATYRFALPGHLPGDVPDSVAVEAAEGIGAVPEAASGAPALADQVLNATAIAFTQGYNLVGVLGGLALLAAAGIVHRVLGTDHYSNPATSDPDYTVDCEEQHIERSFHRCRGDA